VRASAGLATREGASMKKKSPERRALEGMLSAESYIRITNKMLEEQRQRFWTPERKAEMSRSLIEKAAKKKVRH
jgi:hypothetical protein